VIRAIRADPAFDEVPAVAITAQAMKNDEVDFWRKVSTVI